MRMDIKSLRLPRALMVCAAVSVCISPAATAQIEEIIVTATKRAKTLQDVSVSVSVTGAETIQQANIVDVIDLQTVVPSLRITQLQNSSQTTFYIRGFGNGDNNTGIEPSVAVFIDGVYRSRAGAAISDLPNLERVEVLRGPQSTLFGKNASAGVISIVTSGPDYEWGGYVEAGVSNFGGTNLKSYVTGPLGEKLAFSLGGSVNKRDGYAENLVTGEDINNRDRSSVRGQLRFDPSDTSTFRLIGDYSEIDEICCYVTNLLNGPTGAAVAALGAGLIGNTPFARQTYMNTDPHNNILNSGASLEGRFDFDGLTLTSITSFRKLDGQRDGDVDFTSMDLIGSSGEDQLIKTFTQEFRLVSEPRNGVSWLVGGFYFDESIDQSNWLYFGQDARAYFDILSGGFIGVLEGALTLPAGTFQAPGTGVAEDMTQDNTSYSLFGQAEFDVGEAVTITAGLSYLNDEKDVSFNQLNTDLFSNILLAGPLAPFAPLAPLQFLPQTIGFPNATQDGKSSDDNIDFTAQVSWDVTDAITLYSSVSTGYKATSWNLSRNTAPDAAETGDPSVTATRFATPESAMNYELGLKGRFERSTINVAVFQQEIEDFQSNVFTGAAFTLANAGKQTVTGVEIDSAFYPTENLVLTFAGTFLNPEFEEFTNSAFGDISGTKPGGVHETSISTSVTWNWNLKGLDGFFRADYQYESNTDLEDGGALNPSNAALSGSSRTREVNTLNASLGFTKDNVDIKLWARNLFDDEYLLASFPSVAQGGSYSGYASAPRTFGLTVRAKY